MPPPKPPALASQCGFFRSDGTFVLEADLRAAVAAAAVAERSKWFASASKTFHKEDSPARFGDLVRYWLAGKFRRKKVVRDKTTFEDIVIHPGRLETAQLAAIGPAVTYGNLVDSTLNAAIKTFNDADDKVDARTVDVYKKSDALDAAAAKERDARTKVEAAAKAARAASARVRASSKRTGAAAKADLDLEKATLDAEATAKKAHADAKTARTAAAAAVEAARKDYDTAKNERKSLDDLVHWDASERAKVRNTLLAKPGTSDPQKIDDLVDTALDLAHRSHGDVEAWSAAFVVSCVRGAALGLKLEAMKSGVHVGRDGLVKGSGRHSEYIIEARKRNSRSKRGTYHAFEPRARVVKVGDLIATDRTDFIKQPEQLKSLDKRNLHCDIVTELGRDSDGPFAETIGGNVSHSVRRRRYPLGDDGTLIVSSRRLVAQEDDMGNIGARGTLSRAPSMLPAASTGRILALLSPVVECKSGSSSASKGGRSGKEKELFDRSLENLDSPFINEESLPPELHRESDDNIEKLVRESPFAAQIDFPSRELLDETLREEPLDTRATFERYADEDLEVEAEAGEQWGAVQIEHIITQPKPAPAGASSQPHYSFQVVDSANKPLADARWTIHQDGEVYKGTLNNKGWTSQFHAGLSKFNGRRPFRFHVEGYACAIVRGAALLTNDSDVEYGGQFLDWALADAESLEKRAAFWQEYAAERKNRDRGVFRFLQHDHVMRRPVKMLARETQAVFEACPISLRLGPIVRYVDQRRALIWMELETPGLVRVRYGQVAEKTALPRSGKPGSESSRHSATVRVGGRHYALVCLDQLEPDSVYLYTLEFGPVPATGKIPIAEADFTETVFPRTLPSTVERAQKAALSRAAIRKDEWLFFRTMPTRLDSFRFAHGSCRKWPDDTDVARRVPGPDMLERFGSEWLAKKNWPDWPLFFLHTGDQIYADDIGIKQGERILRHRFAAILPGPPPRGAADVAFGAWSGRFGSRYAVVEKTKPVSDDDVDPKYLRGFFDYRGYDRSLVDKTIDTALVVRKQADALRKLVDRVRPVRFKLGVLNHLLWKVPITERGIPRIDKRRGLRTQDGYFIKHRNRSYHIEYPSAGETDPFIPGAGGVHAADYVEYSSLYEQAWSTPHARRSLAHVPSYMIFDDHEVTDDWNADAGWMKVVHTKSDPYHLWPTTMTDGLCSYWVYQGWGNLAPEDWESDQRVQILQRCQREGRDALPDLRRLVFERAIRPTEPGATRSAKLSWHYSLPTGAVPFLVVDLRTDRDVNGTGGLSPERLRWLERSLLQAKGPAAFIILPVPFLMPDPMLFAIRNPGFTGTLAGARSTDEFKRGSDIEHPAGNPVWDQIKKLLVQLQSGSSLKTLAIISGDIHFSCNLDGQLPTSSRTPRLLQLISSGLQQQISPAKQGKLIGAYKGWLNIVSRAQGVDTHRGIRITLGGLQAPGKLENFLFKTSVALVDVKPVASGPNRTQVPLIVETYLTWVQPNPNTPGALVLHGFRHMTQASSSAVITLKDPGFKTPEGQPVDYPRTEGVGLVKELEERDGLGDPFVRETEDDSLDQEDDLPQT